MATQSKSVSQLKSEVLKPSSRPYELIEYNSDKLITKEINPELVASNVNSPYEKNSSGTIIIDKNKDLTKRKMLISLTATKISNAKFNEIIDTEFQDFVEAVDLSQNFLSSQINGMQIKAASDAADKKVLEAKILGLLNQNEALKAASALTKVNINTVPDSISYGTDLNADKSGIGNMLLSKNKKARAVITNTSFKVTLGNYDHTGKLLDGEEVVTFQPVFAGNIGTKNLTDDEAGQYLINNPDITTYMNSYTIESQAKFAEIQSSTYNNLNTLITLLEVKRPNVINTSTSSQTAKNEINNYLSRSEADQLNTLQTRLFLLNRPIQLPGFDSNQSYKVNFTDADVISADSAAERKSPGDIEAIFKSTSIPFLLQQFEIIKWRRAVYNKFPYKLPPLASPGPAAVIQYAFDLANVAVNTTKANFYKDFYNRLYNFYNARMSAILDRSATPFGTSIRMLRTSIANNIRNFRPISSSYKITMPDLKILSITYPNQFETINIDDLILPADRELLGKQNISNWSETKNIIEAAKKHWRYVVEQKPNELDTRFYLSDDQARAYLNNYTDLQEAFGNDLVQAKRHWNYNGINEGRTFAAGNSLLHIYRNDVDKKGYIEIVKGQPWHVRYSSEYSDLSKSSRIFLDDNGILYLYDKAKIVWQSFNE